MESHGAPRSTMELYGAPWNIPWSFMASMDSSMASMIPYKPWNVMELPEIPWKNFHCFRGRNSDRVNSLAQTQRKPSQNTQGLHTCHTGLYTLVDGGSSLGFHVFRGIIWNLWQGMELGTIFQKIMENSVENSMESAVDSTPTEFHGAPWDTMQIHGVPWSCTDFKSNFHGTSMELPWNSMEINGTAWFPPLHPMEVHGIPWNLPWNAMDLSSRIK